MSYDLRDDSALFAHNAERSASSHPRLRVRHVPAHRKAFHRFYREHFGLVWSMVRRFGVPPAQHEDAVQEVWLVAYRRLDSLEPDASAKAWLSTITRRVASRLRRTEHRRRRKIEAIEQVAARPAPGSIDSQDARRLLDALFERLDDDQRTALLLAQVHGLTGPEIAQSLGIPVNTAYSRLRLARRKVERFAGEVGAEQAVILEALRDGEQPPSRAAAHAWVVLMPKLAPAAGLGVGGGAAAAGAKAGVLASVLGGSSGVKIFAVTVGVGVLGLGATRAVVEQRASSAASADAAQVQHVSSTLPEGSSRPTVAEARALAAGAEPAVAAEFASPDPVAVEPPARAEIPRRTERTSATSMRSASADGPSDAGAPDDETLSEEADLLGRAQRSLRTGEPAQALRLLEEHERRFPGGELTDARRGARVRALCEMGRSAQARAEARLLAEHHPGSPVAAGVLDACS